MLDCGNYTKILEQNYKNPGQFNPTSDFTLNECARINYKLVSKSYMGMGFFSWGWVFTT